MFKFSKYNSDEQQFYFFAGRYKCSYTISKHKARICIDSKKEYEKASVLYNQFLNGVNIEGIGNIDDITVPTGEPDRRYGTVDTYQDSNGDDISELRINLGRYYTIKTRVHK